ncbi:MAG: DUF4169 family protein [Proteobacteria bacterium]|nr:DUF4169 family protein [Pseudomonadota bacterium]
MAEIINLRMARKARVRAAADQTAQANRAKHGRTGAEKNHRRKEAERTARLIDGARLEGEE